MIPSAWETIWRFWRNGGPLLIPLAAVGFMLWLVYLRARRRLISAIRFLDVTETRAARTLPLTTFRRPWLQRAENEVRLLRALTAVAPLLGLLGTVDGMVSTFQSVAWNQHAEVIGRLAPGISRALITTQLGLVIAIPGVFGAVRIRRLAEQVEVRLALGGAPLTEVAKLPGNAGAPT